VTYLQAQKAYNSSPLGISASSITMLNDSLEPSDSALDNFHYYKPAFFMQDLGNLASPYQLRYFTQPEPMGFQTGWFKPSLYFHTSAFARYYKATIPYTLASYSSGQRPANELDFLQVVRLMHTQNWGPLFNIGVDINANRCNGFSTNASARTGSGMVFAWFHTPNSRYQVLANAVFNSASNNINGGIYSDSIYENTYGLTKEDRGLLTDSSFFKYRGSEYFLKQFYRFGKENVTFKSRIVKRDSMVTDTIRNINAKLQVGHNISFSNEAWSYKDNIKYGSGFYRYYYFDSLHTHDTLHHYKLCNILDADIRLNEKSQIYFAAENRLHWLNNQQQPFMMNEDLAKAVYHQDLFKVDSGLFSGFTASAVYFFFNTYNELSGGDYDMNAKLELGGVKFHSEIKTGVNASSPTLEQVYFPGNHFYWYNNGFHKMKTVFAEMKFRWVPFASELTGYIASINNLKYFTGAPTISVNESGKLNYASLRWRQKIHLFSLTYLHDIIFQYSGNQAALPVPQYLYHGSFMYDEFWFNKALHIQFGISLDYFSKYYAPGFMPSLNVFYSQMEKQIGNYPQFDAFLNMQIQRVRLFFMSEHFNQDLPGFSTAGYSSLHYPLARRAFRFGISWSFYN
jgi:hypothetical protein